MLDLETAAGLAGARLEGAAGRMAGVCTDSRRVAPGELFVALDGERFDGHDYVEAALRAGACAALVRESRAARLAGLPLLLAEDPLAAMSRLAAGWRARFDLPLVAVTGSNGKTTVKEMLRLILAEQYGAHAVLATAGNLNNHIGVPLTLLRLRHSHRAAVIEMGMNHAGELRHLSGLARPTVALVNNAGYAHVGELGSLAAVAAAKGEIYEGLGADGVAVINEDDANAPLWHALNATRRVVGFGFERAAAVGGTCSTAAGGSRLQLHTPAGSYAAQVPLPGAHNARNALAAAAVAFALGVDGACVAGGLARLEAVPGRLQRRALRGGGTLLDDTYNASPDSVRAAIDTLMLQPARRRLLVLGDMGELGEAGPALHAQVGAYARDRGVDGLVALGELVRHACAAFGDGARQFTQVDALCADLEPALGPDCAVLVKGSRFMAMERVVARLAAEPVAAGGH